ncbi:SDR family NAD(P)-dependent oxidoreductase [Ramlibacter tataouinensis]|uniref:SDR family NAD(P)-dependent oxidoreductase n=1 Tax=Ramlibacter tataouinensis TaxID=94132 RepID=UPI0022F3956B|nr:SDR family oxidoreductase [Ramlibacter tataouinensis]WBY02525.1 SDR family NAD(P)-dependent oxidoreductase [Ramlibacter tataouinensis]
MNDRPAALITGSATGVGAATALQLAQRGWDVVINYSRSEAEANETAQACRAGGADVLVLQGDVAQDADCRRLVGEAVGRWGRLDALVNNAGTSVFGEAARWDALDADVFQRILGVNTIGTFQMVRAAAPHLKAARGSIVNVSSVAGALGIGSSVPYVASKGAVNAMTLHLARTLAPEIRVNAVCPGLITSRWFTRGIGEEAYEKTRQAYEAQVPLGRACTPEDVAESIVWLVTGARTVTGELVLLDSGVHLGRDAPRRS